MVAAHLRLLLYPLQHDAPDQAFGVEFEDLWDLDDEVFQLLVDDLWIDANEYVDAFLVGYEESDDRLQSLIEPHAWRDL